MRCNNKIDIREAIERVGTTKLDIDDDIIASMLTTLKILQDLGFKTISKGDENGTGQHKP